MCIVIANCSFIGDDDNAVDSTLVRGGAAAAAAEDLMTG